MFAPKVLAIWLLAIATVFAETGCQPAIEAAPDERPAAASNQTAASAEDALAESETSPTPIQPGDVSLDAAREMVRPERITADEATSWIVWLVGLSIGSVLLMLFLHARFYSPRVATQSFESQAGPQPGDGHTSDPLSHRYDVSANRPIDDADFPA